MMSDSNDPIQPPATDAISPISDQAMEWFTRLRSEDCSAEERRRFESWRNRAPAHVAAYEEVSELWNDPALQAAAVQAARASIRSESRQPAVRRSPARLKQAAIAATIVGLMVLFGLWMDLPLRFASDYRTSTGERQVVRLLDSSAVTLNTRSAIGTAFDDRSRRVDLLAGEAFFQVAPDPQRPFVVQSHGITTRAVGTEFLVRHEPDGIRVTVTEGVVELASGQAGWTPIQVTAGRQVVVSSDGSGPVRDVDISRAKAWLRGRLVVEDTRLGDVIEELRRYHSGTIQVWNSSVSEIRVSGSYNLADPTAALLALTETLPVRMARVTDHIVVLY